MSVREIAEDNERLCEDNAALWVRLQHAEERVEELEAALREIATYDKSPDVDTALMATRALAEKEGEI